VPLTPGTLLGPFLVLGHLARGGTAEVWLARDTRTDKVVTLKTLNDSTSTQQVQMLMDEARIVAQLSHPAIAQIFEIGMGLGHPFVAMEYVPGRTLVQVSAGLQRRAERMPERLAVYIISQCCRALHSAHTLCDPLGNSLNVVHRDVTPKNVLVSYSGDVKLLDFGIAKMRSSPDFTRPGHVRGTVAYLSPERVVGQPASPAADVWSLGVILYCLLTGRMPFDEKDDFSLMKAITQNQVIAPSRFTTIDPIVDRVVMSALAKRVPERPSSAGAMEEQLRSFLDLSPVSRVELGSMMELLFPSTDPLRARFDNMALSK
jgi:serine/threonine-protein kinase